jgi:hypothetical protein
MNSELIAALINGVLAPELARWLANRHNPVPPTEEEIRAHLLSTTALIVAEGSAWLDAHPPA